MNTRFSSNNWRANYLSNNWHLSKLKVEIAMVQHSWLHPETHSCPQRDVFLLMPKLTWHIDIPNAHIHLALWCSCYNDHKRPPLHWRHKFLQNIEALPLRIFEISSIRDCYNKTLTWSRECYHYLYPWYFERKILWYKETFEAWWVCVIA